MRQRLTVLFPELENLYGRLQTHSGSGSDLDPALHRLEEIISLLRQAAAIYEEMDIDPETRT